MKKIRQALIPNLKFALLAIFFWHLLYIIGYFVLYFSLLCYSSEYDNIENNSLINQ